MPWRRLSPSKRNAWPPALHERLLDPGRDRRLSRTRQPGEQDRGALHLERGVAVGRVRRPRWRTTFGLACVVAMTRITPAPDVAFVWASMMMKLPVVRLVP